MPVGGLQIFFLVHHMHEYLLSHLRRPSEVPTSRPVFSVVTENGWNGQNHMYRAVQYRSWGNLEKGSVPNPLALPLAPSCSLPINIAPRPSLRQWSQPCPRAPKSPGQACPKMWLCGVTCCLLPFLPHHRPCLQDPCRASPECPCCYRLAHVEKESDTIPLVPVPHTCRPPRGQDVESRVPPHVEDFQSLGGDAVGYTRYGSVEPHPSSMCTNPIETGRSVMPNDERVVKTIPATA